MGIRLYGGWRLRVVNAVHSWENRFRVEGAAQGSGTYPPTVGTEIDVAGREWELIAEHRPDQGAAWSPSEMMIDPGIDRVDIRARIGAEDPLPARDFKDIEWDAEYVDGTIMEIPRRPHAVRPSDLFQMPDGIFEASLGTYYMGVAVRNRWGRPFTASHVLDITPQSRAALAARGIVVIDAWSHAELASLGQAQRGTGMVLGPMVPGALRTVFFKVDVRFAAPRKHEVEFVCLNMDGMADPGHPARRVGKQIFVSRTAIDSATGDVVSEVQEGSLRMSLKEFAFDRETARKRRRRLGPGEASTPDQLRDLLHELLESERIDPCEISRLFARYCREGGDKPRDERFEYDPFYLFPTKFRFAVTPRDPYDGQYGPLPYDDPWWKVLLLIIAVVLLIAAALEEASDVAYHDEDLVIGSLDAFQQDDVDAALCKLDTDRALAFQEVLDAQSDEDNQNAEIALDGTIPLAAPVMTKTEIQALLLLPANDPQRQVFKSGATTGLTHGVMRALAPSGHDLSTWSIEQLIIDRDPAFNEDASIPGDSGSVWVHRSTRRPVALNHSGSLDADGNPDGLTAFGSLIEDVFNALGVTL